MDEKRRAVADRMRSPKVGRACDQPTALDFSLEAYADVVGTPRVGGIWIDFSEGFRHPRHSLAALY
jgi:hypothetical protein